MENRFYQRLSLPFEMTPPEIFDGNKFQEREIDLATVDNRLINFLNSVDIEPTHARYFFSVPYIVYNIHRDKASELEYARLNWIFGGSGSKMIWYAPKENAVQRWTKNNLGEQIKKYSESDCIKLEEQHLIGPNLVNVGIYHSMHNGREKRHCYSFFLKDKLSNTPDYMTWEEALPRFKNFVL